MSCKRLQNVDDLLLSGGRGIEFASHLCEPSVDLSEPSVDLGEALVNVAAEVDEVLPKGVEARRRGLPKIAQLTADRGDVAISSTGEHSCGCSLSLTCLNAPSPIAHLMLERAHPRLEIPSLHESSVPPSVSSEITSFAPRLIAKLHSWLFRRVIHDPGCYFAGGAPARAR